MTFPATTRVESVTVRSVDGDTVVLTGIGIGNRQGGSCSGRKCERSGRGKEFTITLGAVSTVTRNDLSITLLAVRDGAAVLKIKPL
jgi:hypothetical protein